MAYFHRATPIAAMPMAPLMKINLMNTVVMNDLPRMTAIEVLNKICDENTKCSQNQIMVIMTLKMYQGNLR
jgi:hypothetical protein